jgi:type III secretion protein V
LGEKFGEQLKELERVLPMTKTVNALQRLMVEQVSIKNFRSILNSMIEWGQRERDIGVIVEQIRRGLHEQICHQYSVDRKIKVFVVSLEIEQLIRESLRTDVSGAFIDMDSGSLHELVLTIESQLKPFLMSRHCPSLVCSMDCRQFLRQIIQTSLFSVPVLSHQELVQNIQVEVLGSIELNPDHHESN